VCAVDGGHAAASELALHRVAIGEGGGQHLTLRGPSGEATERSPRDQAIDVQTRTILRA
jgi:hypothetical protein